MSIEKLYFQKNFQVGEFLYEHLGVSVILEVGQTVQEAANEAKQIILNTHFEMHKEMYSQRGTSVILLNDDKKPLFKKEMDEIIKAIYKKAVQQSDTETVDKLKEEYNVEAE